MERPNPWTMGAEGEYHREGTDIIFNEITEENLEKEKPI